MMSPFDSGFARSVTLRNEQGERRARAFIQPMAAERPETPTRTVAGVVDERRWRILMEPLEIHGKTEIIDGNDHYLLLRWEMMGEGSHIEGVLKRKAGGAEHA